MLNVIALMGRLVADPELRTTPTGTPVATFTLAVDRSFTRQGEQRQADFITVVAWRKTAEFVCKYFQKGSLIAVNGRLETRAYQDKHGNDRKTFEVVADNVHFAGSKGGSGGQGDGSDAPRQGRSWRPAAGTPTVEDDFAVIGSDDPLPFF